MATSIVHQTPQGKLLVGGLDWKVLPMSGSFESHLREGAGLSGAGHAALARATIAKDVETRGGKKRKQVTPTAAGFYSAADDSKLGKGAHSLAAAFASWARKHTAALLSVRTDAGNYAVVVAIHGLPVLDVVEASPEDAYDKARAYLAERPDLSVFADDNVKYPQSLVHEDLLTQIAQATSKSSAIKTIPMDAIKVAVIALVVLSAAGGFWYHSKWKAEKARQEALARQRAADPIPKYLDALAVARQSIGVQRAALQAAAEKIQRFPLAPDGWRITKIGCSMGVGCEARFFRSTGTYASLKAAMPSLELSPTSDINLNEARMTWNQELPMEKLDPAVQLPAVGNFVQGGDASTLQTWLTAGLTVQIAPPQLWPQAAGVPQSFKHPQALASGKFEASGVALPQIAEVLASAPANVQWTGWSIEVGDAKQEPLSRAKARLIGNYYVSNR